MDAKKCDRCNKYYDEYVGLNERNEEKNVHQRYEIPYNRLIVCNNIHNKAVYSIPDSRFDLCPDCMMELDKWINKKGE